MQIETIMMLIPAIQVAIVVIAIAYAGYLMASNIFTKAQRRLSS